MMDYSKFSESDFVARIFLLAMVGMLCLDFFLSGLGKELKLSFSESGIYHQFAIVFLSVFWNLLLRDQNIFSDHPMVFSSIIMSYQTVMVGWQWILLKRLRVEIIAKGKRIQERGESMENRKPLLLEESDEPQAL